jgi:hypothetical protein
MRRRKRDLNGPKLSSKTANQNPGKRDQNQKIQKLAAQRDVVSSKRDL